MALTEKTELASITILPDGQIQVARDRVVMDGTEEIGRKRHRFVLEPGQNVAMYPQRLQNICAAVWTPQVVSDYQAAKAARDAQL